MWSEHRFVSFDGTPAYFRRLRTTRLPARGAVMIVHGMGEHSGRYVELAEFLAEKGFHCYVPDLRGFGKSGGKRGCVRRFTDYFGDLEGVHRMIGEWEDGHPPFFLGHSFGGLVVSCFLASKPDVRAKGLVLSSPNFGIAIRVPLWRHALAVVTSRVYPDLTQPNRVDRMTLTHDLPLLQKHASDRLIHDRISARLYAELVSRIRSAGQVAARLSLPTLILQAGDDRVVQRAATERFFAALRSPDKRLEVFEGLYHELLNETSRKAIFDQIAAWLLQRA